MAWYELDPKSGYYRIRFRYSPRGGTKFNLSKTLKIRDEDRANATCVLVDETIRLLMRGTIKVPDGVDVGEFIVSGGNLTVPSVAPERPKATTLQELFEAYVEEMSGVEGRESTLKTYRYHIAHLSDSKLRDKQGRGLGADKAIASITPGEIQVYVDARSKQRWRGRPIVRDTIEKELETLGIIWRWGMRRGKVGRAVPWRLKDLTWPLAEEKPPFRSYDQIRRKIDRGGLSEDEAKELWDCLYLTGEQVAEVLDLVESNAAEPFVYPMFAFVALTGARRGELLRSLIDDFDFDSGSVTIRGTKGRQRTKIVTREVDIHPRLRKIMLDWISRHPGARGRFAGPTGIP